ncbi:unnamed protein product [Dimorphilus gyrociliatus]|uniref:Uncharacterized protein n=1 Tax=Dimorphilus gyrociliatus TaxID=2664684 RepID=A0A7I8VFP2_9ANNE|nr:unnamed protein product [Dimorphilus gyrociliatus]
MTHHTQESNKEAVLSALKALQLRIRQLEKERNRAEENIQVLSTEKEHFRTESPIEVEPNHSEHLESQLHSVADRCRMLEQQLQDMRKTMEEAQQKSILNNDYRFDIHGTYEPRLRFEDEEIRQETIKPDRIPAEESVRVRRLTHELYDEEPIEPERIPVKNKSKKPKKKVDKGHTSKPKHYHLNMSQIPFISGTSTADSYSVPANIQRVLSMMKCHNETLCKSSSSASSTEQSPVAAVSSSSSSSDLDSLLAQLQDEFGQISLEHQQVSAEMLRAIDPTIQCKLEKEADELLDRMEKKGEQIQRLRSYQIKQQQKSVNGEFTKKKITFKNPGKVKVTTTVKACGTSTKVRERPKTAPSSGKDCLKGLKKIQQKLGKNDLGWM